MVHPVRQEIAQPLVAMTEVGSKELSHKTVPPGTIIATSYGRAQVSFCSKRHNQDGVVY